MMRPRTSTLVAGHPLVAAPLFALHALFGIAYTYSEGFGWLSLYALVFLGWLTNCAKEAGRYRAWQREWNALDPNHKPPITPLEGVKRLGKLVVALLLIGASVWLLQNYDDPASAAHVIALPLVGSLMLFGVVRLLHRSRQSRRAKPQPWIVSQAISRPSPAPSVTEAFSSLPDYCRSPARKDHA
jgi:hypothetical protein